MNIQANKNQTVEVKLSKANSEKSAAERAAEIRESFANGNMDEGVDDFFIDPKVIPGGWTYEWKRFTVFNQEDPSYQVTLRRAGWEPVPATRHPELMPVNFTEKTIIRKGMMLMERPTEITNEIRNIDQRRAIDQVRVKEKQLNESQPGQFERNNKDNSLVKVKKSYEAMPVPDK
jgi:hypothetical protein